MILFFFQSRDKKVQDVAAKDKIQSRFVFHAGKCIGCHSCEVACAEQNGLPADTAWRRVGEIEGGIFPDIKRYFISLSCNHCIDPSCMKGCPASAYHVNERGLVIHDDPKCIGCSYCTWNCPYGVPVFQQDRKIVTKCDMCTNRLDDGLKPACVEACPANAIETEEVSIKNILENFHKDASAPGMPDPSISIPTTKIVLPEGMNEEEFFKTNKNVVRAEAPHFSLILMTVFTQLSVGGFFLSFLADLFRVVIPLPVEMFRSVSYLAPVLFGIAGLALTSSVFHLGRPALFFRALLNLRTSWLSREALGFVVFSLTAFLYTGLLFFSGNPVPGLRFELFQTDDTFRLVLGFFTVVSGLYGIYASSRIYRVMSRPSWNTVKTTVDFFIVMVLTGVPLFSHASAISGLLQGNTILLQDLVSGFSAFAIFFGIIVTLYDFSVNRYRAESAVDELQKSAYLYDTVFYRENSLRVLFLIAASLLMFMVINEYYPFGSVEYVALTFLSLFMYLGFALMTRFLFFVTVVPVNMPGNFIVDVNKPVRGSHV